MGNDSYISSLKLKTIDTKVTGMMNKPMTNTDRQYRYKHWTTGMQKISRRPGWICRYELCPVTPASEANVTVPLFYPFSLVKKVYFPPLRGCSGCSRAQQDSHKSRPLSKGEKIMLHLHWQKLAVQELMLHCGSTHGMIICLKFHFMSVRVRHICKDCLSLY